MIRKAGYAVLAVLTYGTLEALLLGYKYYIIFAILTFFTIAFEVIYFNIYAAKAIKNISVTRKTDTQDFKKNREVKFTLHFVNNNPHPVSIHFFDEAIDVLEISGKTSGTATIPKNGVYDIEYFVTPRYIGEYKLGNIRISIDDTFHIASIDKTFVIDMPMRIYPLMKDIRASRSEMASNFIYTFGNHYSHRIGQGYNIYDIRQYTFEDDPRFIVWNKFDEQNNTILVKEMEEEREITIIFIIDYSIAMNHGFTDRIYDKTIVDIINLSHLIIKNRDNIGFFLYSSEINIYLPPDKNGKSISDLERATASILPAGEFSISGAIENLKMKQKKNVLLFVITASQPVLPKSDYHNDKLQFNFIKILDRVLPKSNYRNYMSIFLINNESYYDYNPKGEFENILMKNARLMELERISGIAREIRYAGIRCVYVGKKDILSRIMLEYNYRRSMNAGA
ncbi:DUF58 domain-containing protein [Ferroplasma sp.]|uniref:DUF58 domain-containing protein n=1 Tax=Ferroplasma sp. TaxID=2591003 RepID=UPI00307CF9E0